MDAPRRSHGNLPVGLDDRPSKSPLRPLKGLEAWTVTPKSSCWRHLK
uniref:Uncharacterized protein n=1 Tax=Anguilla anguilla TaxID=7936 RepID=A0A0E9WE47_ANGAN